MISADDVRSAQQTWLDHNNGPDDDRLLNIYDDLREEFEEQYARDYVRAVLLLNKKFSQYPEIQITRWLRRVQFPSNRLTRDMRFTAIDLFERARSDEVFERIERMPNG